MPGPLNLFTTLGTRYKFKLGFLHPYRKVKKNRPFEHTRYKKIDQWIHKNMYPIKETYRGAFEGRRNENFCRPQIHFEEIYDRINAQRMAVVQPSPVHLVWRVHPIRFRPWWEKVVMRKLGLHYEKDYERVLIPNTPHYNRLLWEVKHLIRMKPLTFPDGIPTEKDIGRVKFCMHTGVVRIGDQYKVPENRLNEPRKPIIYEPRYQTGFFRHLLGIFRNRRYQ